MVRFCKELRSFLRGLWNRGRAERESRHLRGSFGKVITFTRPAKKSGLKSRRAMEKRLFGGRFRGKVVILHTFGAAPCALFYRNQYMNTMKTLRMVCLWLTALLLAACGQRSDRMVMEGKVRGLDKGEFYVYSADGLREGVDTVRVLDGEFRYECGLTEPTLLTLLFPNFSQIVIVAAPGDELAFETSVDRPAQAQVKGSKENELLTDFRQKAFNRAETQVRDEAEAFIRKNPATLAALAVYQRYFERDAGTDAARALSLLDVLKKAQPRCAALQRMDIRLRALLQASTGRKLPDFKVQDLRGDTVDSRQLRGKPLVILFWGTWNSSTYAQPRQVRRLEREWGDRVRFLVVGVDYDAKNFATRFRRDSLDCPMVCEGDAFASPLAEKLGVRTVPGNLLVDAGGVIRARDLDLGKLEQEVRKLLP